RTLRLQLRQRLLQRVELAVEKLLPLLKPSVETLDGLSSLVDLLLIHLAAGVDDTPRLRVRTHQLPSPPGEAAEAVLLRITGEQPVHRIRVGLQSLPQLRLVQLQAPLPGEGKPDRRQLVVLAAGLHPVGQAAP